MRIDNHRKYVAPTDEDIAGYAHHLWDAEGRQCGRDLEYWFEAKTHLTVDRQYEAGVLSICAEEPPRPV